MGFLSNQLNPALDKLGENEKAIVTAALYGIESIVEGGIELANTRIADLIAAFDGWQLEGSFGGIPFKLLLSKSK